MVMAPNAFSAALYCQKAAAEKEQRKQKEGQGQQLFHILPYTSFEVSPSAPVDKRRML